MIPRRWITPYEVEPSPDRLCDYCGEKPIVVEAIIFQQTQVDPAEWYGVCEDHRPDDDWP
jgi:hypothetical protein